MSWAKMAPVTKCSWASGSLKNTIVSGDGFQNPDFWYSLGKRIAGAQEAFVGIGFRIFYVLNLFFIFLYVLPLVCVLVDITVVERTP